MSWALESASVRAIWRLEYVFPFRVFDEAARCPDIKVVQSRCGLTFGRMMRLVGGMPGARRTAFIVPPSQIVTPARSFGSLAHVGMRRQGAGFLMTVITRTTRLFARPFPISKHQSDAF